MFGAWSARLTNLVLLGLLSVAFATGWIAFELSGQPARGILVLHAAAGVGIVLLVPWKSLIAHRGLRHPHPAGRFAESRPRLTARGPQWKAGKAHSMRWASMVLAAGVLISLAFGFLHSSGRPDVGYLTAMDFHVGAALCVIPFVVWHVAARPARLRPTDLTRRNLLKGAALLGAAGLGVVVLPSARRAPTGSFHAELPIATQWMFDSVQSVDGAGWSLAVAGRKLTYDELAGFDDRVTAALDCTGGWYSEQEWEGVWLNRIVPAGTGALSVNVRSVTGYSRRFAIEDAPRLLLATRMNGSPLGAGNGFPVRLVVPGQRGFSWVKWVASIDAEGLPSWWQPPFPLQ